MPQVSGPLADQTFTDAQWRAIIGDEPAVVGDVNGSAYNLTLSASSDVATLGSTSQDSTSVVAGFMHQIVAGQTQEVTIPPATTAPRTDIIAVRYDPTYTTAPGPCRLYRIPGVEGAGTPTYDAGPPGAEDLPLWSVTRGVGQSLSQATRVDMRIRRGPSLTFRSDVEMQQASTPLGTTAYVTATGTEYIRRLDPQLNPVWSVKSRKNYGTSGALVGTPGIGQEFVEKVFVGDIVTNINGVGGFTFPGGPFANGVLGIWFNIGRNSNTPSTAYELQTGLTSLTTSDVKVAEVVNGTKRFVGANVRVPIIALVKGW